MSTLIPSIAFTDFKKLKAEQLKRLKSAEITFNGEYLFTFVQAQTDYIRIKAERLALLNNTQGGVELADIRQEGVLA